MVEWKAGSAAVLNQTRKHEQGTPVSDSTASPPHSVAFLLLKECEPLRRTSAFSYTCRGCGQCCRCHGIPVSETDIDRIAAFLKTSAGDFVRDFTEEDGKILRRNSEGCVFLRNNACRIYSVRPYVCRIYPLRKRILPDGEEEYALINPATGSTGRYGTSGTVQDYLESNESPPPEPSKP